MKNGINMGQFHVKTGFLGNGRRNLIFTPVNTETGSHKYENRRTKIEKQTDRNGNISVRFQPYSTLLAAGERTAAAAVRVYGGGTTGTYASAPLRRRLRPRRGGTGLRRAAPGVHRRGGVRITSPPAGLVRIYHACSLLWFQFPTVILFSAFFFSRAPPPPDLSEQ